MRFSYGLPTHRVDRPGEFLDAAAVAELAAAAEAAGFAAVHTTDHPFPPHDWVAAGGHHSLDPLVALAVAAAATTRIRLQTHLLVAAYRNPFLMAKGVATLDVLSGGRTIVGLGAGYLEAEFDALGVPFSDRNARVDEAIAAMRAAWRGEPTAFEGKFFRAAGNATLPRPLHSPHPPLWIGGNSRRAIRRAVELGDGWCPFAARAGLAAHTRTVAMDSPASLAAGIEPAHSLAVEVGRVSPLTVCFAPSGLAMGSAGPIDPERVLSSLGELAELGVHWVTVALPGETRNAQLASIEDFGRAVLAQVGER